MKQKELADRIKRARTERGFTQKDLAKYLNKTASNVSDMERCRVQVTVVELQTIAEVLNKPIEYFYGTEFGNQEIEDVIILLRSQNPAAQAQSISAIKMWVRMLNLQQELQATDRDLTPEEMQTFLADFFTFLVQFDQLRKQVDQLRESFMQVLQEQDIDLETLMSTRK